MFRRRGCCLVITPPLLQPFCSRRQPGNPRIQRTRRQSREVLLETRRPASLSSASAGCLATWLAHRRSHIALDLFNFFVADVAGLGALTFIYLITPEAEGGRGMDKTKAGLLMTTLGMVGVCAAPLVGMAVDTLRQKRALVACGLSALPAAMGYSCSRVAPSPSGRSSACRG